MSIGQQTRVGRLKIRVDRVIYTTITLLTVLIIYDGWEQLRSLGRVTVIAIAVRVPPLTILVVLTIVGVSYTRIIQVIVLTGVLSLGLWGGVAGRRAGLTGWALVLSIASGLVLGGIILVLQALLQPGHEPFRP